MENKLAVGKEVLSYCGKCKLPLIHVIVALKNPTTIATCECKTCKAVHLYRDPVTVGAKKKTTKTSTKKAPEKVWSPTLFEGGIKPKTYSMSGSFKEGDLIAHPTFGKGVVEKILPPNKMETLFEQGMKILIFAA